MQLTPSDDTVVKMCRAAAAETGAVPEADVVRISTLSSDALDLSKAAVAGVYCKAIQNICKQDDDQMRKVMCGAGVVKHVLKVLDTHPSDVVLQTTAFACLLNLVVDCEPNKRALMTLNGLPTLIAAAKRCVQSPVASRWYVGILSHLSLLDDTIVHMVDNDAVAPVFSACKLHLKTDTNLLMRASYLFSTLARE